MAETEKKTSTDLKNDVALDQQDQNNDQRNSVKSKLGIRTLLKHVQRDASIRSLNFEKDDVFHVVNAVCHALHEYAVGSANVRMKLANGKTLIVRAKDK